MTGVKQTLTGQRFELTAEHVALLRAATVIWDDDEWGAAAIDPKRPYGNGDYLRDIHRIVAGGAWDQEHGLPAALTPKEWGATRERYVRLHRETRAALQVVLSAGTFEPGTYTASKYGRDWTLVKH